MGVAVGEATGVAEVGEYVGGFVWPKMVGEEVVGLYVGIFEAFVGALVGWPEGWAILNR